MFSGPEAGLLQTIFPHFPLFPAASRRDQPPRTKAQFRAGSPLTANRFVLFPPSPVPASFYQSRPQGLFFLYYAPSNPHRNYCMCFKARRRSSRLDNNTQVLPTTEFLLTSSSFVGRSCVLRFEAQLYLDVCQLSMKQQGCHLQESSRSKSELRCKEDMETGKKERITFRQVRRVEISALSHPPTPPRNGCKHRSWLRSCGANVCLSACLPRPLSGFS